MESLWLTLCRFLQMLCEESCNVTAVVILKQSPVCRIRRMSKPEAFRAVYAGLTVNNWDSHFVEQICDLAGALIWNCAGL